MDGGPNERVANMMKETVLYRSGLTRWTLIAIFYSAVVMLPVTLYTTLVAGASVSAGIVQGAQFMTVLLFTELARILGKPLTKQEVFIIYTTTTAMGVEAFWLEFLFNAYLRTSPIMKGFNIVPPWFIAPPIHSQALLTRNFMHPDWFPIFSIFVTVNILARLVELSLGLLAAQLYVEVERLPFPLAEVDAQAVATLAEGDLSRMRPFVLSSLVGASYGLLLYGVSTISLAITGVKLTLIPFPWIDMNSIVELALPGGSFGVATSLVPFATGIVIPSSVAIAQGVSGILVYLFGNALLQKLGVFRGWLPGMNVSLCWQRSILDFWASAIIGASIAAGITPTLIRRRYFIEAFKTLAHLPSGFREAGYLPLWAILAMYICSTISIIGITLWLVPSFIPYLWVLILISPVWSFLATLVSSRSIGLSGVPLNVPFVKEGALIALPYSNTDIWFAPLYVGAGGIWVHRIAVAKRTQTNISSVIMAYFISLPIQMVMGFIYLSSFWKMAPIPSNFYPATAIEWPVRATWLGLWATKQIAILDPMLLVESLILGVVSSLAIEYFKLPLSFIGFVLGMSQPVPYSVSILVGALIVKNIIVKAFGREWFERNKSVIVAGLALGEGLSAGISAIVALVAKSLWILPY
jgi:hypothetical protein